jgi:hypothetical protein
VHSDDGDLRGLFRQAPPGKFNCLRRLRPNLQPWPLMEQRRCSAFAAFLWRQSAALDGDGLSDSAIQAFNSV